MTADELRAQVQAAGGRGVWEYYQGTDDELRVVLVADYDGKTLTTSVGVSWQELREARVEAGSFERGSVSAARDKFARDMKLPKPGGA